MLKNIKAFVFDLDGTLYLGDKIIDGAIELIEYLQQRYKVLFFTNASSKTSNQVCDKLNKLGIQCNYKEIYTSSDSTVNYLVENKLNNVYAVGSNDFCNGILNKGIKIKSDESADHLVVGLDSSFEYYEMSIALSILLKGGKYIVCNEDRKFPVDDNKFLPGCGAITNALSYASNRNPDFIVGKPNTYMLEQISKDHNITNEEMIIVGDSFESDIRTALSYKSNSIFIDKGGQGINIIKKNKVFNFKNLIDLLSNIKGE